MSRPVDLRTRLVVAASLIGLATLGAAFTTVFVAVNGAQERQLDEALLRAAHEEAKGLANADPPGGSPPLVGHRPGPAANDVGPLPTYVAVYWPEGRLASASDTFAGAAPSFATIEHPHDECFDLQVRDDHLRAVLVTIPEHPGTHLLMAVSRADLDGDAAFLARAMLTVFGVAVAWTAALAWWIVGRLTRTHRDIVAVARRVAAGDFAARVGAGKGGADPEGLGRDIDDMIERLAVLLRGQQQFIAQAAHELRSPLTALYGELSFALRRERTAAEYRSLIEEALGATRRLKALAEDLLSLARLGAERRIPEEPVAISDVVAAAVRVLEEEAQTSGVAIDVAVGDAVVRARAGDLERVIRNLLENAIRHTPPGTSVMIGAANGANGVEVTVRDHGPGVKPEDRQRIFEPFYRAGEDRARSNFGAGLGLTIARDITRLHGGDLVLVDDAKPGACFIVRLPA
jgi:two-component system, OmpR family, sensor kinase